MTLLVIAIDEWGNHIGPDLAPTVTTTELDNRPDDALGEDSGVLTVLNPDAVTRTGRLEWACSDMTACAGITEHHLERWNVATRTYEPVTSIAAAPNRIYRAAVPLPLGETSYFRITGILADGTPAAVVHYSAARGDYV